MRNAVLSASALVAAWCAPALAETLHVRADLDVNITSAASNGRGQRIRVGRFVGRPGEKIERGSYQGYLRFDLSTLSADAIVTKAALRLFASRVHGAGRLEVFLVDEPWEEHRLSHDALPALGEIVGSVDVQEDDTGHYVVVDVSPAVRRWLGDGTTEYGLALLVGGERRLQVEFDSKENVRTSHAPEIELALQGEPGPQGPRGEPGPTGPPGPPGADLSGELALLESRVAQLEALVGSCIAGLARCGQSCVDLSSDANNCGACGNTCSSGQCSAGVCRPRTPADHTFLVPYLGQATPASILEGTVAQAPKVDAYQLLDRSASMSAELAAIKNNLASVLAEVRCSAVGNPGPCIPDLWTGAGAVGYSGGEPYRNFIDLQPFPNLATVPTSEPAGCCAEPLTLALWSVATGQGSAASGCAVAAYVPRATCSGSPAGTGGLGYPCYRPDALHVVMLATDEAPLDPGAGTLKCPSWDAVVRPAANSIGLRVVGILGSGASPQTRLDLQRMATETGAVDAAGQPLVFDGADAAAPLAIKQALLALAAAPQTFSAVLLDDASDSVDVNAAFVARVETDSSGAPECSASLTATDDNGDGFLDTYVNVPLGATMCWRVVAKTNTSVPPAASDQSFGGSLEIRARTGGAMTRRLVFVVPGQ